MRKYLKFIGVCLIILFIIGLIPFLIGMVGLIKSVTGITVFLYILLTILYCVFSPALGCLFIAVSNILEEKENEENSKKESSKKEEIYPVGTQVIFRTVVYSEDYEKIESGTAGEIVGIEYNFLYTIKVFSKDKFIIVRAAASTFNVVNNY